MTTRQATIDTGLGVSCIASTVVHLAVFLLLVWWGKLFPINMNLQETYYVDVVNLPVSAPQAGSPQQKGSDMEAPPPTPKQPDSPMTAPPAPKSGAKKTPDKTAKPAVKKIDPNESAFAERMSKLEGKSDAKQQEATLERLRSKVTMPGSGKAGMPGGSGKEAGSDYSAYIKSRLEDALKVTSFYTTKKPEVVVRLYIAADGRLAKMKIERSSGDAAFELAVRRAIELASDKFPPPPNHKEVDLGVIFNRKGVSPHQL